MPTKPLRDVMADLETGGKRPGCVIFSIGAVYFSPNGLFDEFYTVISSRSCREHGLKFDTETMKWWNSQTPEARAVVDEAEKSKITLPKALDAFTEFLKKHDGSAKAVKLWGCGPSFDNVILTAAYHAIKKEPPWLYWNDRCYRTLKALSDPSIKVDRSGTYHNALDDAKTQAEHAARILKAAGREY